MRLNFLSRITAAALALLLALALVPSARFAFKAEPAEPSWTVPGGYNAHDYNALASFLEQTNSAGKKNGEWLNVNYSANDPATWGSNHFTFTTVGGQKRISAIDISNHNGIVGSLDLSGCTSLTSCSIYTNRISALNVTGCTALFTLYCYNNNIAELDLSTNTALSYLSCHDNALTSIDVSHNPNLIIFNCGANSISEVNVSHLSSLQTLNVSDTLITSVDVSHNSALKNFYCRNNAVTDIDLSHNPQLVINGVHAEGRGTVGTALIDTAHEYYVYAVPAEGAEFIGWYDGNDHLLSDSAEFRFYSGTASVMYARFSNTGLLGDVNFDGVVTAADALIVLRYAMDLAGMTPEQLAVADMNGDGVVNASDAIIILRLSMGLIH